MFSLKLITNPVINKEVRRLMEWRKKVQVIWHEDFEVTFKGTKKWITDINNGNRRKLFFIIVNDEYIGHVGYEIKSRNSIYIDNVIRGVKHKYKGVMSKAVLCLIDMAKFLGYKNIYVKVVPDNLKAIHFYKELGFKQIKKGVMKYENLR